MFSGQAEEDFIAIVKRRQINILAERIRQRWYRAQAELLMMGGRGRFSAPRQMRRGGSLYSNRYSARFWMRPRVRAPARASTPKSATSGMELPVAGSAAGAFCASSVTGGGVTT